MKLIAFSKKIFARKKKPSQEGLIGEFVENLDFLSLLNWAGILKIEPDEQTWLDDDWPDREDKLKVLVAEAMMEVGK